MAEQFHRNHEPGDLESEVLQHFTRVDELTEKLGQASSLPLYFGGVMPFVILGGVAASSVRYPEAGTSAVMLMQTMNPDLDRRTELEIFVAAIDLIDKTTDNNYQHYKLLRDGVYDTGNGVILSEKHANNLGGLITRTRFNPTLTWLAVQYLQLHRRIPRALTLAEKFSEEDVPRKNEP